MRVLITGWSGYIAPLIARVLESQNQQVTGIDAGYFEKCVMGDAVCVRPKIRKDVRDLVPSDIKNFDAIIHLAALSNEAMAKLRPEWTYQINVEASLRLARMARDVGVKRFLFASSCSIYGVAEDSHATESSPLRPLSEFALSKVRVEEGLRELANDNFTPVYLRCATAYGISPRMRLDLVLNNLTGWAFSTGRARVLSDGSPWRPLVHVEDIARAYAAILMAPKALVHDQAFNVGVPGENYRIRDLGEIVQKIVPGSVVSYAGGSNPDSTNYRVSFDKISRTIPAYRPTWNVRKGVDEMYAAFLVEWIVPEDLESRNYIRIKQIRHLQESGELDENLQFNPIVEA